MYDKKYIAERLKHLRLSRNLSANQLSIDLGLNQATISKIETASAYPSFDVFFKICDRLKITPAEFFNDSNIPIKLSPEQARLISMFSKLDDDELKKLNDFIEAFNKG